MGALWALVPSSVRSFLAWAGAIAVAILAGLMMGLGMGRNRERVSRLEDHVEARNRADAAATDYRSGGGASERLRKHDF